MTGLFGSQLRVSLDGPDFDPVAFYSETSVGLLIEAVPSATPIPLPAGALWLLGGLGRMRTA